MGPDLGPNCLTLMVFLKAISEKVNFKKSQNYPACKKLTMTSQTLIDQHWWILIDLILYFPVNIFSVISG